MIYKDFWNCSWGVMGTLPTVYENVLSYEQQVRMLICDLYKLKDIVEKLGNEYYETIEGMESIVEKIASTETKRQFRLLKVELDEEYRKLLDTISEQNLAYLKSQKEAFAQFQAVNMNNLNNLQREMVTIKSHVDALSTIWQSALRDIERRNIVWKDAAIKSLTEEIQSKLGKDIYVLDPVDRLYKDLNTVLQSIYNLIMKSSGITVNSFRDLKVTVDEFENMYITVDRFQYNAQEALRPLLIDKPLYAYVDQSVGRLREEMIEDYNRLEGMLYVTNAFTGERQPLEVAVNFLFNLHQERGVTVYAFEKLNETVEEFADRKIQVYTFAVQGLA